MGGLLRHHSPLCPSYKMVVVLDGLGVDVGCLLVASYVADCVSLVVLVVACSLIFNCLCDLMPNRRVCTKEQNFSRRVFAILLS